MGIAGGLMTRRKNKPVSFDAMVKLFMRNYSIPNKKDVEMIMARLDRIEDLLRQTTAAVKTRRSGTGSGKTGRHRTSTATGTVLEVIRRAREGIGVAEIQQKTGYAEKKIYNIIYRLDKAGRITRLRRGVYTVKN